MILDSKLRHRCNILDLIRSNIDGIPGYIYEPILHKVHCFLDLSFIRSGKDPQWAPEAGRAPDRQGLLMIKRPLRPGMRIQMLPLTSHRQTPLGTFQLEGPVEEIFRLVDGRLSHYEVYVKEVAQQVVDAP